MKLQRISEGMKANDIDADEGSLFVVVSKSHHAYGPGCVIRLSEDDGTTNPFFKHVYGPVQDNMYSVGRACCSFSDLALLLPQYEIDEIINEGKVKVQANGKTVYISKESAEALGLS